MMAILWMRHELVAVPHPPPTMPATRMWMLPMLNAPLAMAVVQFPLPASFQSVAPPPPPTLDDQMAWPMDCNRWVVCRPRLERAQIQAAEQPQRQHHQLPLRLPHVDCGRQGASSGSSSSGRCHSRRSGMEINSRGATRDDATCCQLHVGR